MNFHSPGKFVNCQHFEILQAQTSARFVRLIFPIGLRQAKIVDGVHGDACICDGIEWSDRRFRPRIVGAVEEGRKVDEEGWNACRASEQHLQLLLLEVLL